MNFFEVLWWMGALCFVPIVAVVVRDAASKVRLAPPAGIEPTSSA